MNLELLFHDTVLPVVILLLEGMGVFVVFWSAIQSFAEYLLNTFLCKSFDVQFDLANGLATALEFKMAAEILKTLIVHDINELLILGLIVLLRAVLSLLIHFEMKHHIPHKRKTGKAEPKDSV